MRRLTRILLTLLAAALGLVAIGPAFVKPVGKRLAIVERPAAYGLRAEDITFRPPDRAITLRGWWIPGDAPRAALVFVHGGGDDNRSLPNGSGLALARDLVARHYALLMIDLRNFGESDGTPEGITYGDLESNDVVGAVNEIAARSPNLPIGAIGFSMGGATVLRAAAHAKIAIDALEAGKDVYVEKPMTHTVEQALRLRDTVKRTGRILQVGPNATANDSYWVAREALQAGRIGKVTWAQGSYNRNARLCLFNEHQKIDPTAGPAKTGEDHIDWDMWLGWKWGLAPKIPWNPEHFFRFRKYWPYNGGVATDLLYHKLAPLLIAIAGPNGEYPRRVNANGGLYIEKDGRDIPDTFLLTADYPGEWSLFLVSTLTNDSGPPDRIYGKYGTLDLGGEPLLKVNGPFAEEFKKLNGGLDEVRLPIKTRRDLEGNFIDVLRGKDTLACNVDLGCSTMVTIKLAVESYRQQRSMLWDAKHERLLKA